MYKALIQKLAWNPPIMTKKQNVAQARYQICFTQGASLARWLKSLIPQRELGDQCTWDLYAVCLRLLAVRKPAPANAAINPETTSNSTFAPVDASLGIVVVVAVGVMAVRKRLLD